MSDNIDLPAVIVAVNEGRDQYMNVTVRIVDSGLEFTVETLPNSTALKRLVGAAQSGRVVKFRGQLVV